MAAPADALAAIPDQLSAVDAAPLLCAGVTTFNAPGHSGAMPGDVVAVLVSAASAISECSSQTSSAFAPWRSPAAPIRRRCRGTWVRTTSSTARPRTSRREYNDLE